MNQPKKPKTKAMETVTLIASGYEWDCPKCEYLNLINEATETVKCGYCNKEFLTSIQHAEG